MGDAGVDVEYDLMKKYHLNADVLKLGHHGSKTSSSYDFLDTVRPKIGLVSAGLHNRYGHPSSQVISRCHSLGIHTLDTKEVGMIRLCTFHGFMWMETASGLMSLVEK
jgi:competence protein ComEC